MALQLRRAKTHWSGCCQMTVQGTLWLAKRLSLNLNFSFFNRIRYFSYQVATQLSSRGWVDPVSDLILPEKFLGYSRESNPGPLGWQSDVLTNIPNRWSNIYNRGLEFLQVIYENFDCDLTHGFFFRISINIFFMIFFLLWFNTRIFYSWFQ